MAYNDFPSTLPELLDAYDRGPDLVAAVFSGLNAEQMTRRPIAGKWSMLELICHLSDTDLVLTDRIKRTLALNKPLLMGFDELAFLAGLQYHLRHADDEVALMRALRKQVSLIVRSLPATALDRQGVHSEAGLKTVRNFLEMSVGHVNHHLKFAYEKRKALGL